MSAPFDLSKPNRPVRIGVILMGGETEILDVAVVDLLHGLTKGFVADWPFISPELKAQALDLEFHWVNETGKTARLTGGIKLQPTEDFATAPPLDIVVMGANHFGYQVTDAELAYVSKAYEESSAFITICGGIQIPLQAGLLAGKTVTAPRGLIEFGRQLSPSTTILEKRWVRDGKLWTSGALLNGLDLMRAFATETWGGEGTLMDYLLQVGHCPARDVDYKDAPSAL